jgi:type IX secretion system PorP/SprF family membrane protein
VNPDVVLKPSVLVKYVQNAPVEADFNLNVLLANVLWIGGSYRTQDAIVGLVELQVSKKLRIGYSYDFTTTEMKNYSQGSHEIMIGYDFGYDIMKMKTPRYF